jgi:hypothetical protein
MTALHNYSCITQSKIGLDMALLENKIGKSSREFLLHHF